MIAAPDHLGAQNEVAWIWSRVSEQPSLIGDSLDWGQDLARLGAWVSRHRGGGSTRVCVYGPGGGDPYGLRQPDALSSQGPGPQATYLAVSEAILYADQINTNDVKIGETYPTLDHNLAKVLLRLQPWERVGRTIRIYRLCDLIPTAATSRRPGVTHQGQR